MTCKLCHQQVDDDSTLCFYCGQNPKYQSYPQPRAVYRSPQPKKRNPQWTIRLTLVSLCIGLFIGVLTLGSYFQLLKPQTEEQRAEHVWREDDEMAYAMAQEFIKERLKAPRTAKFPWKADSLISLGRGHYQVIGTVDAQNSFGALLRGKWICQVQELQDEHWVVSGDCFVY